MKKSLPNKNMLIGIDGNEANNNLRVGIGEYAYQILIYLYKLRTQNSQLKTAKFNFRIYLKDKPIVNFPTETLAWQYKIFGPKRLWTQIALPSHLFLEKVKPNVFFTPSHYSPRFAPCKRVISIMDLSFIFYPEMFRKKDLWQLKLWTSYSVKAAWKILTISQFSKEAIVDYYKVPSDKVVVTYPGYDKKKFKVHPDSIGTKFKIEEIKNKYRIRGDYILYVGTLQPRKNISRLIEAFNTVIKQYSSRSLNLVLVGKKGWLYEEIFRKVEELKLTQQVIFANYVNGADLPDLYRGAKCFILPSLYEGFGLPVIEAMGCGTPVVISRVSSLPEIVGNTGILVNPQDIEDIAAGIYTACFDLSKRVRLIKEGLARVKRFSWEKCADLTFQVLKESTN